MDRATSSEFEQIFSLMIKNLFKVTYRGFRICAGLFKAKMKDTEANLLTMFTCFYRYIWASLATCLSVFGVEFESGCGFAYSFSSSVFIIDFEQVITHY